MAGFGATIATIGAGIIRYDVLRPDFITGFLLLQVANVTFAAGQVGYKHSMLRFQTDVPAFRTFGYFFLGALIVALPSFLILGDASWLPASATQWWWLLYISHVCPRTRW